MRCHNFLKRGKTRGTKRRLVFVLRLIGWKDGAGSFDESQGAVEPKQTQIALYTSIEISLSKQLFNKPFRDSPRPMQEENH